MALTVTHAAAVPDDAALVAVGGRSDHLEEDADGADLPLLGAQGFEGKVGQTALVGGQPMRLMVGLGPSGDLGPGVLRRVGAAIVKAARREPAVVASVLDHVAEHRPASAEALAEGLVLGAYRYGEYKDAEKSDQLTEVVVAAKGGKTVAAAVEKGAQVAAAVSLARDLVNEPGGSLTPTVFAKRAEQAAAAAGLTIEVLDKAAIEKAKLGGLLGVNRGSTQPPRFVKISHEPANARGFLALVGKGITFDSGGLSLKTADGMIGMKGDMGGAAAVLGALVAAPVVAPRLKVVGYIPLTDNMVGGDATRVGDVLRARNGKTIEVLNTDAEGRLVLADALSLATEDEPDAIVDLATLTGACMVALGDRTAGLMGNHDGWIEQVQGAADVADEPVWPLPLPKHIRKAIDSEIADLRNIPTGRYGGALAAGLFLEEFVGDDIAWAHLDIAGPAWGFEAHDEIPKGGTGFGVRTLARLMAGFKKPGRVRVA
jgi:leucyl aminopeptidase